MKAIANRTGHSGYTHSLAIRHHRLTADEPPDLGGADEGPSPQELLAASLAACTAITLEMYAERKGWELSGIEVECEYAPAERGAPTNFDVTVRLPSGLSPEQIERLRVIAAKCPVHRTLEGEVVFHERIELAEPATEAG
jgi:putative redox protein